MKQILFCLVLFLWNYELSYSQETNILLFGDTLKIKYNGILNKKIITSKNRYSLDYDFVILNKINYISDLGRVEYFTTKFKYWLSVTGDPIGYMPPYNFLCADNEGDGLATFDINKYINYCTHENAVNNCYKITYLDIKIYIKRFNNNEGREIIKKYALIGKRSFRLIILIRFLLKNPIYVNKSSDETIQIINVAPK